MIRIVILGATGSIGLQTLDVAKSHLDKIQIVGLAARSNGAKLKELAAEHGLLQKSPISLALDDEVAANLHGVPGGLSALEDLVCREDVDLVVVATAGVVGLRPTISAIKAGKKIALASKEVLVAAGELIMPLLQEFGTLMTPIDSEHSAIFQCLQGYDIDQVSELILTSSGGPFRGKKRAELLEVTPEQAGKHPTWPTMGGKITVDSATLMNKALEMIEAVWLFGVRLDQVQVCVHPQSVVHSMIRLKDGSVLGQLGWPDMRMPIQVALFHPLRTHCSVPVWNPWDTPQLTFEKPDEETFLALQYAREAFAAGGTMPCVFNAANEEAVAQFLNRKLSFLGIYDAVKSTFEEHQVMPVTFESLLGADEWARIKVREFCEKI